MKTKNCILVLILTLFISSHTYAQVKIGFKGGYNISTTNFLFKTDASRLLSLKPHSLAQLSIPIEITVNPHYAMQPEVHFKQTGNSIKSLDSKRINNDNFINYWGLGFMNKFKLETNNVTPYALLGLQFNYATNGKIDITVPDGMEIPETINLINIDFDELGLNRFDMNFRVGAGLAMKVRKAELLFEVTYDKGMIDMDKRATVSAYNEKGIGILIGIMKEIERKDKE